MIPRLMKAKPEEYLDETGENLDPEKIFSIITKNEKPGGHGDRAHAVGAIDMAVWDTIAKIERRPLYKVLADRYNGGKSDDKVFTYAAGGYYYPGKGIEALQDEMKSYLDRGFTAVKMKIGGASLAEDLKRIEAVIRIIGSGSRVGVDANGRFDLHTALAYGKAMEQYGLMWYEEAGDPLDYALNATLCEQSRSGCYRRESVFDARCAQSH